MVGRALLPGSTAGGRSMPHHGGANPRHSKRGRLVWYRGQQGRWAGDRRPRAASVGQGPLWEAGYWQAHETESGSWALAFGTGKEATRPARAQWRREQDPGGHSSPALRSQRQEMNSSGHAWCQVVRYSEDTPRQDARGQGAWRRGLGCRVPASSAWLCPRVSGAAGARASLGGW